MHMRKILIRCGIGVLSIVMALVLWQSLMYIFAISRIDILEWIAVVFSYWFISGWLLFAGLSVFIYYLIASHFLNRQASHQ